jgi:hypothetical protein
MAIFIIIISITTTYILFKATLSRWLSFIVIITFSSGIITLFIYTASLAPNEERKIKKSKIIIAIPLIFLIITIPINNKEIKKTIKIFTNQIIILIIGTVLILVIVSISSHGHNPTQTISTSF